MNPARANRRWLAVGDLGWALFLASLVGWQMSFYRADNWLLVRWSPATGQQTVYSVLSNWGYVAIEFHETAIPLQDWLAFTSGRRLQPGLTHLSESYDSVQRDARFGQLMLFSGFSFHTERTAGSRSHPTWSVYTWDLRVPWWSLMLVAATGATMSIMLLIRRWRRFDPGLCVQCGFDLRSTVGRCPECGRPTEIYHRFVESISR